jgi:hypothetical protein
LIESYALKIGYIIGISLTGQMKYMAVLELLEELFLDIGIELIGSTIQHFWELEFSIKNVDNLKDINLNYNSVDDRVFEKKINEENNMLILHPKHSKMKPKWNVKNFFH